MSDAIKLFFSRDEADDWIDVWNHAPTWRAEDGAFFGGGVAKHLGTMKWKRFKSLTGLAIKPGQCLKIKLTAEVLEGEDGNGN